LEAGLFLFVVSFILLFLIRLIGDLDNPFGFSDADSAEDVNIDILMMTIQRLQQAPHPLES
jgi:predicted membrane chloride channel (bestrophin family)